VSDAIVEGMISRYGPGVLEIEAINTGKGGRVGKTSANLSE
jgi:hypothetical protein